MKRVTLFGLLFLAAGCGGGGRTADSSVERNRAGEIIKYLSSSGGPALRSVERWEIDYFEGVKLETEHYRIYTTLLDPLMLSRVCGFMESAYMGYNGQLPEAVRTGSKFDIYLFGERDEWESFTRGFAGEQAEIYLKIKAGAYYLNGACVAYNIGRERTFSVLGHEGWHQFNSRHFRYRLPSWLDEGVATMFEVSSERDGFYYFEPKRNVYRLGALKKAVGSGRMMSLQQLVGANPGEVLAVSESDDVGAFYGQAFALVLFLKEGEYGKRVYEYRRLLFHGLRGEWPLSQEDGRIALDRNVALTSGWNRRVALLLFEEYVSGDIETLEAEYRAFCRKLAGEVRFKDR